MSPKTKVLRTMKVTMWPWLKGLAGNQGQRHEDSHIGPVSTDQPLLCPARQTTTDDGDDDSDSDAISNVY